LPVSSQMRDIAINPEFRAKTNLTPERWRR
jgi:hypothetical protein